MISPLHHSSPTSNSLLCNSQAPFQGCHILPYNDSSLPCYFLPAAAHNYFSSLIVASGRSNLRRTSSDYNPSLSLLAGPFIFQRLHFTLFLDNQHAAVVLFCPESPVADRPGQLQSSRPDRVRSQSLQSFPISPTVPSSGLPESTARDNGRVDSPLTAYVIVRGTTSRTGPGRESLYW